MNVLNIFKKKLPEVTSQQLQGDIFYCHYCQHPIDLDKVKIILVEVPVLYISDNFTTGKGVACPECKKISITG